MALELIVGTVFALLAAAMVVAMWRSGGRKERCERQHRWYSTCNRWHPGQLRAWTIATAASALLPLGLLLAGEPASAGGLTLLTALLAVGALSYREPPPDPTHPHPRRRPRTAAAGPTPPG